MFIPYNIKKHIILSGLIIFLFAGCKQVDKFTHFEILYDESIVIPATTVVNLPLNLQTPDIPTNSQSSFDVNNTNSDLVEEINLTGMTITLTSPTGEDFSFLKSVHIFISAQGLSETEIAWKDNITDISGNSIQLDVSGADLKDYIRKDNIALRVNTVTDELLTTDHQVDVHSVFFVDAKILGQ